MPSLVLTKAMGDLQDSVESMCCDINHMLRGEKWIDKILEKNMYCAIVHSGATPASWARGELYRFFSSSFETRMGNVLGGYAESLIKQLYPDAEIRAGGRKKPVDLDAFYRKDSKEIHLQVKSCDKWGNSSQKEALAQRMCEYTRTLRNFDSRIIQNVWGYTGGRSYQKTEKYKTDHGSVDIFIVSNEKFWEFVTDVSNFCSQVITPAINAARSSMSTSLKQTKESAVQRLTALAKQHVLANGLINFPELYQD